jgi:antitoxin ParD1/3/4
MPVRTTLSFTKRHHDFMTRQVKGGVYATQSALVADAIETLIREEEARETALIAMADEIRRRMQTPREEYITWDPDDNPITRMVAERSGA